MTRDQRRLAAIVSADVVGYSALMGRDESGTLAALKAHRRVLIDPKIAEYGGRIVKTMGDGLLIEFPSVVDAVRCSVDVQRGMEERNHDVPAERRIAFRVGINVGDIIIDGDDIFGDGVNVAARLQALADPGGICVSRAVRDQVLDKLGFAFDDLGAREVKNIARPVEVFRVALDPPRGAAVVKPAARSAAVPKAGPLRRPLAWAAAVAGVAVLAWIGARHLASPAPVVPYSIEDRRMTFAVLPFTAPSGDEQASRVATAMQEVVWSVQDAKTLWATVVTPGSVEQAAARHTATKDLAVALRAHFILRGHLARAAAGFEAQLLIVDGSNERVLGTEPIAIPAEGLDPRSRDAIADALGSLTYRALEAEVQRARGVPDEALDVRDLAFRAYVEWNRQKEQDGRRAYTYATELLQRALARSSDDRLALYLMAHVNLCDCVEGWSKNVAEQQAIGAKALDQLLKREPDSKSALSLKAHLHDLRGQHEEALVIADGLAKRFSGDPYAMAQRATALLKLGRPRQALDDVELVLKRRDWPDDHALAAAVHYQLGNDEAAARHAREALTRMADADLRSPARGAVALTLVAAEARAGRSRQAEAALQAFNGTVSDVRTVSGVRQWMRPHAFLAGYEPLYEGLRLAGMPN